MLYIFQVDLGCMYTFELNLSLESVATLKNAITAKCNIAFDNQVLLISGGDYLEDNCPVHQYNGAGTVSNPIFLFNKSAIMTPEQYSFNQLQTQTDQFIDLSLKQVQIDYESTLEMDASLKTIIARTELAKKVNLLTTDIMSNCEKLIRDQHFMYQGWQAVTANLDDVSNSFVEHVKNFEEQLTFFLTKRDDYHRKLKNFEFDLDILEQIMTLPSLHAENVQKTEVKSDSKDEDPKADKIEKENKENIETNDEDEKSDEEEIPKTLLNLINQNGKRNCLDKITVYCKTMLEQFSEPLLERMKEEMNITIKTAEENKKIKKIESRLFNLDLFLIDVRRHVEDQNLLTLAFIQNQNSANTCNDPTIFSDLCNSHKTQLDLMIGYLSKAMTIKKKFQNSKRELIFILLARLKTIMACEIDLNSLNWRVLLYSESLKKLRKSIEVIDQINLTPKVYFNVFQEVNRRNKFNFFFNLWSKFVVQMNIKLIDDENEKRSEFRETFSNHFLKSFFPASFDDDVPEFAVNLPDEYDQSIPSINEQEFREFIKQNKKFDSSLEAEDSLLNGLICRLKDNMKDEITNNESTTASIEEKISEDERIKLASFVDSLFPIKQKAEEDEVEKFRNCLNEEYATRLNELKLEYELKFDAKIKELALAKNPQIDVKDTQTDNSQESSTKKFSFFFNCHQNFFKNLVDQLLSMKYSDYLKDNERDLKTNGPSFISFVETIFSIAWPRLR